MPATDGNAPHTLNEIPTLTVAIALWIGGSIAFWLLHRWRTRRRENRQLEQAAAAVALVRQAQSVFDVIRTPELDKRARIGPDEKLRLATHQLLKRIQENGAHFDEVNALRVQIQASRRLDDYAPLSDILHMRRDLWAASEILLVEDPASFGATFAEEGAYDRIHSEAQALLFKRPDVKGDDSDDLIDLRLSITLKDAETEAADLRAAIDEARERDRLPTPSEIIAYPLGFIRAIPAWIGTAYSFLQALFGYAAETAQAIRESQTVARGGAQLRQVREDWPQRLSASFHHASEAARDRATALRRHYDFLVTAYDFQTKYEQVLRRTPDLTERGRQFIARLELAERSERLRLTSASASIWVARRLMEGLALLIAWGQAGYSAFRGTTAGSLVAGLLAPVPSTGRRRSTFRSFHQALALGGISDEREAVSPAKTERASERKAKRKSAVTAKETPQSKPKAKAKAARKAVSASQPVQPKPEKAAKPKDPVAVKEPVGETTRSKKAPVAKSPTRAVESVVETSPAAEAVALPTPTEKKKAKAKPAKAKKTVAPEVTAKAESVPPIQPLSAEPAKALPSDDQGGDRSDGIPPTRKRKKVAKARSAKPAPASLAAKEKNAGEVAAKQIPLKVDLASTTKAPQIEADQAAPTIPVAATAQPSVYSIVEESARQPAENGSVRGRLETASAVEVEPVVEAEPSARPARPSLLKRLFSRNKPEPVVEDTSAPVFAELAEKLADFAPPPPSPDDNSEQATEPAEAVPTLMAKLSRLDDDDPREDEVPEKEDAETEDFEESQEVAEEVEAEDTAAETEEPGPLTLSLLELEVKMKPKTPQIRSFPWLRG